MNDFKCIKNRCYSPMACGGFGYCRDRNQDGYPMNEANIKRRKAESDAQKAGKCSPPNRSTTAE